MSLNAYPLSEKPVVEEKENQRIPNLVLTWSMTVLPSFTVTTAV
jgi:hypothetical protein